MNLLLTLLYIIIGTLVPLNDSLEFENDPLLFETNALEPVISTANADSPMKEGLTPLLVFDVWEHAYYLDYLNKRANHLESLWKIVNWDVVENRLKESARKCNKNKKEYVLKKYSQYDGCSSVFRNCS